MVVKKNKKVLIVAKKKRKNSKWFFKIKNKNNLKIKNAFTKTFPIDFLMLKKVKYSLSAMATFFLSFALQLRKLEFAFSYLLSKKIIK